jgi:hypothetical protein
MIREVRKPLQSQSSIGVGRERSAWLEKFPVVNVKTI